MQLLSRLYAMAFFSCALMRDRMHMYHPIRAFVSTNIVKVYKTDVCLVTVAAILLFICRFEARKDDYLICRFARDDTLKDVSGVRFYWQFS